MAAVRRGFAALPEALALLSQPVETRGRGARVPAIPMDLDEIAEVGDDAVVVALRRTERESALRPAMAGSLGPTPAAPPASAAAKKHGHAKKRGAAAEDGRDFVAVVPKAKS